MLFRSPRVIGPRKPSGNAKTPFGRRNTRRCWINSQFPLEIFIGLLSKHLETFKELENLQATALNAVKNHVLDGLAGHMTRQGEVLSSIAREKADLRPYLDQWEGLKPEVRQQLRDGKAGQILLALEDVAKGIQAKHQEMFGAEDTGVSGGAVGNAGASQESVAKQPDLSQTINAYRALQ